jgi:hypothetical protein
MKMRGFISPILMLVLMLAGCSKPGPAVSARNDVDYYTCTMHPWVHSKNVRSQPICGNGGHDNYGRGEKVSDPKVNEIGVLRVASSCGGSGCCA